MNPAHLLTLDGTLHRVSSSGTDDYNNPTTTTADVAVKCWIEQDRAEEDTADSSRQEERFRIYLHPDAAPVTGLDSLTVGSDTFQFVGPPWSATSPRTRAVTHIEATGRQVQ